MEGSKKVSGGWGGLSKYSVYSWPSFVKVKARFGQVGDQFSQVKDQVGQGQGQELDNIDQSVYHQTSLYHFRNIRRIS